MTPQAQQKPASEPVAIRKPAAWTDLWLRALPWRTLIKWKREMESTRWKAQATTKMEHSRRRRLVAEYFRRKREGGGGLASGIDLRDSV